MQKILGLQLCLGASSTQYEENVLPFTQPGQGIYREIAGERYWTPGKNWQVDRTGKALVQSDQGGDYLCPRDL